MNPGAKWLITTLAVLAAALAVAPAGAWAGAGSVAGPGEERQLTEVPRLGVNCAMDQRWTAVRTKAQGERDLVSAAASAGFEEIWAFIPEEERWVEVGCCERRTDHGTYVGLETYLLTLMRDHSEMAIYHIHYPTPFIRENYHPSRRMLKEVEEVVPSRTDMVTMAKLSRAFRRLHPQGRVTWHICSRHGVTTYALTPEALADNRELDYGRFRYAPFDEEDLAGMSGLAQAQERAIEALDGPPFVVSFRRMP